MNKSKQLAFKGGSYSLIMTAIVLAIVVVVNICVSALPSSVTKYDISSSKLYSITSNTKAIVNRLDREINIYWIVQAGEEDAVIENMLSKYASLSEKIKITKKNPDIFPTFAQQYTTETVSNNSLVVESGERYRYIPYTDIYVEETDMWNHTKTVFDGEGAVTSGIDYVTTDVFPQAYVLEGHGEWDLPAGFASAIEKENIETKQINLLTTDRIPEDAACVIIYEPQKDILENEIEILKDYAAKGGKLFIAAGPVLNEPMPNLYSILEDYGVTPVKGIVVEADPERFVVQMPYVILPFMESSDITDSLIEANYDPIFAIGTGLDITNATTDVTSLMHSSDLSFSKVDGYAIVTYEKESKDIDGPFSMAVSIDVNRKGRIIWFSAEEFLEDTYNDYSAGANTDLSMNALAALIGESESMAIRTKSLNHKYLTMTAAQGDTLKLIMIAVLPLLYLGAGIFVYLMVRRKQNEEK